MKNINFDRSSCLLTQNVLFEYKEDDKLDEEFDRYGGDAYRREIEYQYACGYLKPKIGKLIFN